MHSHAFFPFISYMGYLPLIIFLFIILYYIINDDQHQSEDIHRLAKLEPHPVSAVSTVHQMRRYLFNNRMMESLNNISYIS